MPYRQSGSGDAQTVASLPSAPLPGSAIILMSGSGNSAGMVADGWTDLIAGAFPRFVGGGAGFGLWGRFAGVGDDGDYTIQVSDYVIVEYTGVTSLTPLDPTTLTAQGPGAHASVAFNPVYSGDVLVLGAFIQDNAQNLPLTPDAGYTLAEEFLKNANGWKYSIVFLEETNAGSYTPGITASQSGGWGAAGLALTGATTPAPPAVELHICDPDGTNCVLIERATAKKVRVEENGTGSGAFQISRYDAQATFAILAQGNILQFTFPEIDPDVLVECILEEGDFTLISSDEEGGELLSFGGKGTLNLLAYARLGHQWLDLAHPKLNFPSEGVWRWTSEEAAGIIRRIIGEAQLHTPPALSDVTHGGDPSPWSDTHDSYGNPFYDMAGTWEIPIGTDLLTASLDLARAGMIQLEMRPGFVLWAYDEQGFDKTGAFGTGTARFEKGVNIGGFDSTELIRQMHNENFTSNVLIHTKDGYLWYNGGNTTPDYVKESFLDLSGTNSTNDQERSAARALLRGIAETEGILLEYSPTGPNGEANDPANGWFYPGFEGTEHGQFWVGDLVTLHTGSDPDIDFVDATFKVYAITLYEDETGALAPPILELNAQFIPADATNSGGGSTSEGGTGGGGSVPVNAPHVHTQYAVASEFQWAKVYAYTTFRTAR